jgi:hypothetical protein
VASVRYTAPSSLTQITSSKGFQIHFEIQTEILYKGSSFFAQQIKQADAFTGEPLKENA